MIFGLEFPPISHLIRWPGFWLEGTAFEVNKVVLLMWFSAILTFALYFFAGRRFRLVPSGVQNLAEAIVDFVNESIILQTIGPEGLNWGPFLLTMFTFIFFLNIWEVIPVAQMPATARIAIPLLLALLVWIIFNFIGLRRQGVLTYFKNVCFPPGVPWPLYILVAPIEFISTIIMRPFSLAVRLFANMLAGHLLLTTFAIITAEALAPKPTVVISPFSFALLVGLTGFEVLVAVLQAFIYTILTAVYIGGAMHPEH